MRTQKRTHVVRISQADRTALTEIAAAEGVSVPECLHRIIKEHTRNEFFKELKKRGADR